MEFVAGTTILANISAFVGLIMSPFKRLFRVVKPKKKNNHIDDRNNIVNIHNDSGTVNYNEQIYNCCDET